MFKPEGVHAYAQKKKTRYKEDLSFPSKLPEVNFCQTSFSNRGKHSGSFSVPKHQ